MHPLRNILNKILWDEKEDQEDYLITYIHRGAPSDSRQVSFIHIKKIGKSWFSLLDNEDEVLIPFHRIVTVQNTQTGEILWRKR